ncbi:hypothetical protein [Orientia tsutsugamushi]|uniref:hypothetical protein n=1 Tax=Orientia tsutsugamushi TaxID=784 RepID=UPI0007E46E29|nr:hypothetical protein [Orientia tsutsugamushi]
MSKRKNENQISSTSNDNVYKKRKYDEKENSITNDTNLQKKRKYGEDENSVTNDDDIQSISSHKKQRTQQSNLLEENIFKDWFMVPLKHIASTNIIIRLWINQSTIDQISNLFNHSADILRDWRKLKNSINDKILTFRLPESITQQLVSINKFIGTELYKWIKYHDKDILYNDKSEYLAINYICNIEWTPRGTINYLQTARNILARDDNGLSNDQKYRLACNYCLEDSITNYAQKVNLASYLQNISIYSQPMVYFWTSHTYSTNIKSAAIDVKTIDVLVSDYNNRNRTNIDTNTYIFNILVEDNCHKAMNCVPIEYIWNRFSYEEQLKKITLAINKINNREFRSLLLSQLDYEQQKKIFQNSYFLSITLMRFLNDLLLSDYFLPIAYNALNIMPEKSFFYLIDAVADRIGPSLYSKIYDDNHYKFIFKELWQFAPKRLKEYVLECNNTYLIQNFIVFKLFLNDEINNDIDIAKLVLADANAMHKYNIMFCGSLQCGVKKCRDLIIKDQWNFLDTFIKLLISSTEDINTLKQELIKDHGYQITIHFYQKQEYDKAEHFLKWCLESDKKIKTFKKELASKEFSCQILESMVTSNKSDFIEIEHYFQWCASNDLKIINELKESIPQKWFQEVIFKLIEQDQYELLDQILNWCFSNDQEKINNCKNSFYTTKGSNSYCCFSYLIYRLIEKDDSFQLLDKFVKWCFTDIQKINQFKKWILCPQDGIYSLCTYQLQKYKFELADKSVAWAAMSHEEIDLFKNKFMVDKEIEYILDDYMEEQDKLQSLIKWFSPSIEIIKKFKEIILNMHYNSDFSESLDRYLQECENVDHDIKNDVNDTMEKLLLNVENITSNDQLAVNAIGELALNI